MKAANKLGEITWKEGISSLSKGLYKGIAGNGYLIHSLYREYRSMCIKEPHENAKISLA
jgi:hypothetical protein